MSTLGEAGTKTGWPIHAYCLMGNHFHLVAETPQPHLGADMKWLLGTYTGCFNRRHQWSGHLFSGRYKSLIIDERGGIVGGLPARLAAGRGGFRATSGRAARSRGAGSRTGAGTKRHGRATCGTIGAGMPGSTGPDRSRITRAPQGRVHLEGMLPKPLGARTAESARS